MNEPTNPNKPKARAVHATNQEVFPRSASNEIAGEDGMSQRPRSTKNRTSLRLKYEAEVEVIKRQVGDLEQIREKLGLSRRKVCQLLLVDPSAWSRWTRDGKAPPHIYRALQWYQLLQDKNPLLDERYWLAQAKTSHDEELIFRENQRLKREQGHHAERIKELNSHLVQQAQRMNRWFLIFAIIICVLVSIEIVRA